MQQQEAMNAVGGTGFTNLLPIFDEIEIDRHVVPGLHIELGLVSVVINKINQKAASLEFEDEDVVDRKADRQLLVDQLILINERHAILENNHKLCKDLKIAEEKVKVKI